MNNEENKETEELTETAEQSAEPEVELNDEGVPRPPVDPKNGLYTFLSLLIFAVLYIGYHFVTLNFFSPYTVTFTDFTEEQTAVLCSAARTPVPDGGELSYARISRFTDNNNLYVRYRQIPDTEIFLESVGFEFYPGDGEQRIAVFRDESTDVDYVYADIYYCTEGGDMKIRIYEFEGVRYAEFVCSDYGKEVRSIFRSGEKIRQEKAVRSKR